jgi:hypothetical protein
MTTTQITDIHADAAPLSFKTLRNQIGLGALMTVGARHFVLHDEAVVSMTASIHPRIKDGRRGSSARNMEIRVSLGFDDLYRISVRYPARGTKEIITHWEMDGIYNDDLARIFVSLDSGTESR